MTAELFTGQAGEILELGHYPYEADGTPRSITWRILAAEDERALALSSHILDVQPYHMQAVPCRWEDCSLRQWLNGPFLQAAFTPQEQALLCRAERPDDGDGELLWRLFSIETPTGAIGDPVFLLSAQDADAYFSGDGLFFAGLSAPMTPYARARAQGEPGSWLRSSLSQASMAFTAGACDCVGASAIGPDSLQGVRPMIWLRREKTAA